MTTRLVIIATGPNRNTFKIDSQRVRFELDGILLIKINDLTFTLKLL